MNTTTLIQLVLGGFGISGILGAGVALFKLRPDVNSAAVTQSQGAMETMQTLNDELKQDRDAWRDRAIAAEKLLRDQEHARGG